MLRRMVVVSRRFARATVCPEPCQHIDPALAGAHFGRSRKPSDNVRLRTSSSSGSVARRRRARALFSSAAPWTDEIGPRAAFNLYGRRRRAFLCHRSMTPCLSSSLIAPVALRRDAVRLISSSKKMRLSASLPRFGMSLTYAWLRHHQRGIMIPQSIAAATDTACAFSLRLNHERRRHFGGLIWAASLEGGDGSY